MTTHHTDSGRLRTVLVGDVLVTRRIAALTQAGDLAPFVELVSDADAVFGNFESLIHDYEWPPAGLSLGRGLRAPSGVADDLAALGFTVVSRANNHALGYGVPAMMKTSEQLDRAGIAHAGVGQDESEARSACMLDTASGRVAMLSVLVNPAADWRATSARDGIPARPGVAGLRSSRFQRLPEPDFEALREIAARSGFAPIDADSVLMPPHRFVRGTEYEAVTTVHRKDMIATLEAVAAARPMSDALVVSIHVHGFVTDAPEPSDFLRQVARSFADAGADIVVCHGIHVLRGVEIHSGKIILYGLGNFFFQPEGLHRYPADAYAGLPENATPATVESAGFDFHADRENYQTVAATVDLDEQGDVREARFTPFVINERGRWSHRGVPTVPSDQEANEIAERLARMSSRLGCDLLRDGRDLVWRR